ncbi:MAG TPA: hypothetical protein VJY66_01795 [Acholeplasma sp.]|nr:hypothetical protein [Acholeplasma sp.]
MKKYLMVLLMMLVFVSGCEPAVSENSKSLKEVVTLYQAKLNTLLDDEANKRSVKGRYYNDTPYDETDMVERDVYLALYNKQLDNSNQVLLTPHLKAYKDLLDKLNDELDSFEVDVVEANIELTNQYGVSMTFNVYVSKDSGVVIRYQLTSNITEEIMAYGVKLGYEADVFYVKQLIHYEARDTYEYFEFLEGTSLIEFDYRDEENFKYKYTNQTTNESFDWYISNDTFGYASSRLMWFNPKTNIRTIYADGYEPIKHFSVINEKGIVFSYTDSLDGMLTLWFQLLEASGWDYAYLDSNAHRNEGVYKDDEMLFKNHGYRQFNVDLSETYDFANVSVMLDLESSELTNDILSLKTYNMKFNHDELTKDFITSTIENSFEESKHLAVYRGVDFNGGNIKKQLINQIDKDLK